jgi:hypothetical protein
MKKYTILTILFVVCIFCVKAQVTPFIRGGVSFPSFSLDNRDLRANSIVGFHGGLGAIIDIPTLSFEFEPSVQLALRGAKIKNALSTQSLSLLYIDVPLMVNLPLTIGQTGVFAGVGGMFSYATAGWKSAGSAKSEKMNLAEDIANRFDFSARVHGGLRVYGHQLSLFYERGFINLSPSKEYTQYNSGWGILYAYIF